MEIRVVSLSFAQKYMKRQDKKGTNPLVLARGNIAKRLSSVCLPRGNKPQVIPYCVRPLIWVRDRETCLNNFQTILEFTEELSVLPPLDFTPT